MRFDLQNIFLPTSNRWLNIAATFAALYAGKELALYTYRRCFQVKHAPSPPSPPAHPLLQHIPLMASTMRALGQNHADLAADALMKRYPELGEFFVLKLVAFEMVFCCDPEAAKEVMITHNYKKSPTLKAVKPVMGAQGLPIIQDEHVWARHRKVYNPGFTPQYIREAAVPIFVAKTQQLLRRLQSAAMEGRVVKLHVEAVLLTFDIICMVTFSKDFGCMSSAEPPPIYNHFVQVVNNVIYYENRPHLGWMKYLPWEWLRLRQDQARYDMHLLPVIQQRIAEAAAAGTVSSQAPQHHDILALAISTAQQEQQSEGACAGGSKRGGPGLLTAQDALSQIKTFLFAGHDTTASTMAFAVYEISRNPEVQRKVLEEVDRVCGRTEAPTALLLVQLKYLGAVIKEALRLWPPGATVRIAPTGAVLNGFDVGGKLVYVPQMHVHRNPKYWGPDAHEFKPDRWLDEAYVAALHPCAYMPFSKGPRDCLGQNFANMEMRLVLAMLYQHFTFTYAHSQPESQGYHLTTYPLHHVPVKVQQRNT